MSSLGIIFSLTGCINSVYEEPKDDNKPQDPNRVTLVLNVGYVAMTREISVEKEKMHSLRIILIDAGNDGKVEFNRLIQFNQSTTEYREGVEGYQLIATSPGKKKIYFIANEESVENLIQPTEYRNYTLSELLNSIKENTSETHSSIELINSISFNPENYKEYIPLTSSYEFEIDKREAGSRLEKDFYLVNAATKFEFEFINYRGSEIIINDMTISSIAEEMYLMAHFGKDLNGQPIESENKFVEWTDISGEKRRYYWIDWLREVSNETNNKPNDKDPGNENTNKKYGWIKDYELPEGVSHKTINVKNIIGMESDLLIPGYKNSVETYTLPIFYCPESKFLSDDKNRQEYKLSIKLYDKKLDKAKEFNDLKLSYIDDNNENLVTLFRNTHVKVKCILDYDPQDIRLQIEVGICPWDIKNVQLPKFD